MLLEAVAAGLLGVLVLWVILHPLYRPEVAMPAFEEPEDPEETRRGIALIALKEIDFDRATGKLSDADYAQLKQRYTVEALEAIRESEHAGTAADEAVERLVAARVQALRGEGAGAGAPRTCRRGGPRPEPDARFCSSCGGTLIAGGACAVCRTPLEPGARFCGECGAGIAA